MATKEKMTLEEKLKLYSEMAIKESGMDEDEIIRQMKKAKAQGIMYKTYARFQYWRYPESDWSELPPDTPRRRRIARKIAEEHDRDLLEVEREMFLARKDLWMQAKTFELFGWDQLDEETRQSYLVPIYTDRMCMEHQLANADETLLDDKAAFNRLFSAYVGRKWFEMDESTSFEEFRDKLQDFDTEEFVVKLLDSYRGIGISKYSKSDDLRAIFEEVHTEKRIAEECIVQHDEMQRLCPESVNGIRLVCLYWNDEFHLLYGICRMGAGKGNIADNFSQGGLAVSVDTESGKFNTNAVDKEGDVYEEHPMSGVHFLGFQVPFWNEVVSLAEDCSKHALKTAGLGYVGWDIAITENGPIVIEGNNRPGINMIQLCMLKTYGKGVGYLLKDYLDQ